MTVSGADTLIWFTLDNVRSINVVDLSLQATARSLFYQQQITDSLRLQSSQRLDALFKSEISYNRAIEINQAQDRVLFEQMKVQNSLQKDLERAKKANSRSKTLAFGLGVVVGIETILLILTNN